RAKVENLSNLPTASDCAAGGAPTGPPLALAPAGRLGGRGFFAIAVSLTVLPIRPDFLAAHGAVAVRLGCLDVVAVEHDALAAELGRQAAYRHVGAHILNHHAAHEGVVTE